MSRTAAQNFMSSIAGRPEMQQALNAELRQASDPIAATSQFAQNHGYAVTPEDLKVEKKPRNTELSDDDLEAVSGGTLSTFDSRGIVIWMKPGLNSGLDEQGIIVVNS